MSKTDFDFLGLGERDDDEDDVMLKRKKDYRWTSKGFYMKKDRRKNTYLTLTTQRKIENGKKRGKRQVWRLENDFALPLAYIYT